MSAASVRAQTGSGPELRQELLLMVDEYVRLVQQAAGADSLIATPVDSISDKRAWNNAFYLGGLGDPSRLAWHEWESVAPALRARRDSLGRIHGSRLTAIVESYGYPSESTVGTLGHSAVYLLWRHSVDPRTQEQMLPLVIEEKWRHQLRGASNEEVIRNLTKATLTDRVHLRQHRTQVYGTQLCRMGDTVHFFPIANREKAERLRGEMGLTALDEFLNRINEQCPCSDRKPCPSWVREPAP